MALYLEYEELRRKYLRTQRKYDSLLSEKERLFAMTQPRAVRYDVVKVSGGVYTHPFDKYLEQLEQMRLDERLSEARSLLNARKYLLMVKEQELRASQSRNDKIYVMRFLDYMRVYRIAKTIGYSESQVYRIIERIEHNIKVARKCEK